MLGLKITVEFYAILTFYSALKLELLVLPSALIRFSRHKEYQYQSFSKNT